MVGKVLGHYEILEPLGKGGMGEVYRARDTKLDRDVAIKVLPEDFAADPERLARFEREAKLLASVNHANIAAIYGLEDEGDQRFIVMEVVEGETLADRIGRSGRIEVGEALEIARQIAAALEAAHDSGVVHRDLKPANVVVTPEGRAKVLDFGLAKAYETDGTASGASLQMSHSPTMMEATRAGVIMGTAAYMSPEQAKGKPLDKRTDIWSFGCVLYEMLTARAPFAREDVSDTLAAILRDEPDWNSLPGDMPIPVAAMMRRCLSRDRDRRLHDIADARIEIEEASDGSGDSLLDVRDRSAAAAMGWRRLAPWGIAVLALVVAAGGYLPTGVSELTPTAGIAKLSVELPPGLSLFDSKVGISNDGQTIAFFAQNADDEIGIWLRRIDDLAATPLEGAQNLDVTASNISGPSFSPEDDWIVFADFDQFYRVSAGGGGEPVLIGPAYPRGAAWMPDDTIVFGPPDSGFGPVGLVRTPVAGGGEPAPFTLQQAPAELHRFPQLLPEGRLLFTQGSLSTLPNDWSVAIASADGQLLTTVLQGGTYGRYVETGHLVFGRRDKLYAVEFDLETLETKGLAEPVLDDLWMDDSGDQRGWAAFDFSSDGTLVYVPAAPQVPWQPVFINMDGERTPLNLDPGIYGRPRGAPSETSGGPPKIAIPRKDPQGRWEVVIYEAGALRMTLEFGARDVAWFPDGTKLAAVRPIGTGAAEISMVDAATGDVLEQIVPTNGAGIRWVVDFVDQGRKLLYEDWRPDPALVSLMEVELATGEPIVIVADVRSTVLSPDERGLAYVRGPDVFVKSYVPGGAPGPERRVSVGRGRAGYPVWLDDRTLSYRTDQGLMVVDVGLDDDSRPAEPEIRLPSAGFDWWQGHADFVPGTGFVGFDDLGVRPRQVEPIVILNWFEDLKRQVPTGR